MWTSFINYIDTIDPILGLLGFISSLLTFFLSLNIQKKVTQKIEKLDYNKYIDEHLGKIKSVLDKLNIREDIDIPGIKRMTNDFVSNIKSKYTFLPYKLRRRLIRLIKNTNFESLDNDKEYYKFRNEITVLTNLLEKEKQDAN